MGQLTSLPPELLLNVARHFGVQEIVATSQSNRHLKIFIDTYKTDLLSSVTALHLTRITEQVRILDPNAREFLPALRRFALHKPPPSDSRLGARGSIYLRTVEHFASQFASRYCSAKRFGDFSENDMVALALISVTMKQMWRIAARISSMGRAIPWALDHGTRDTIGNNGLEDLRKLSKCMARVITSYDRHELDRMFRSVSAHPLEWQSSSGHHYIPRDNVPLERRMDSRNPLERVLDLPRFSKRMSSVYYACYQKNSNELVKILEIPREKQTEGSFDMIRVALLEDVHCVI